MEISNAERLARAVLLFYDPTVWDNGKAELWTALVGVRECNSRTLCDLAREVRKEEEEKKQ